MLGVPGKRTLKRCQLQGAHCAGIVLPPEVLPVPQGHPMPRLACICDFMAENQAKPAVLEGSAVPHREDGCQFRPTPLLSTPPIPPNRSKTASAATETAFQPRLNLGKCAVGGTCLPPGE